MATSSMFQFPPTPQDWVRIQDAVKTYYVDRKLPLKEVRSVLHHHHGFRATDRMIKARLKSWGYLKNAKREDWHFLALLHDSRIEAGKPATVFDVRGHRKTVKDLHRFVRNQNMDSAQFLAEARTKSGNKPMPDYIQAFTPTADDLSEGIDPLDATDFPLSPQRPPIGVHELRQMPPTLNGPGIGYTPTNHERHLSDSSHSITPSNNSLSPRDAGFPAIKFEARPRSWTQSRDCNQIQRELEMLGSQLTQPIPLPSRTGGENISSWALISSSPSNSDKSSRHVQYVCSRCNQPSDQHFVSLDGLDAKPAVRRDILNGDNSVLHLPISTRQEGSWVWVSRCFLACMCLKKGDEEAAEQSLREASNEFERLLMRRDRQLLTAAGLVMTVLHMHDQGDIAKQVIESAFEVTERVLRHDDPIYLTFKYLSVSANIQQREQGITSSTMHSIYTRILEHFPAEHEYSIAAHYNWSWMLKFDGLLEQGRRAALQAYTMACRVLGKEHMQSVTCLAVAVGCMDLAGNRPEETIRGYERVIRDAGSSLGRHHPYTLEARRRLANLLVKVSGPSERTLHLLKDVLWGRVHMLGPTHTFTIGARTDYEEHLATLSLHVDTQGRPSLMLQEVGDLFRPGSPGSWTYISRRSGDSDVCMDDEDDYVMLGPQSAPSSSPKSNHEFEAY